MFPNKGANEHLVTSVVDFMSGCGCGPAILKSDDERATVALQEAEQRQSVTWHSRERSERSRWNATHVEDVCRGKVEGSDGQQACATSVACDARKSNHQVHDGKTAYQRLKNKRPSNKILLLGENVVWRTITEGTSWIRLINSECSSVSCQEQDSLWFLLLKAQWRCVRFTGSLKTANGTQSSGAP